MNKKKVCLIIILILVIALAVIFCIGIGEKTTTKDSSKIQIVVSNFASYDFLRAIIGDTDDVELTFLMGPGKDAHSYDPTSQDIVTIQESDLFVYIGGEMEEWTEKVLDSIDTSNMRIICIADDIETIEEKDVDRGRRRG